MNSPIIIEASRLLEQSMQSKEPRMGYLWQEGLTQKFEIMTGPRKMACFRHSNPAESRSLGWT